MALRATHRVLVVLAQAVTNVDVFPSEKVFPGAKLRACVRAECEGSERAQGGHARVNEGPPESGGGVTNLLRVDKC